MLQKIFSWYSSHLDGLFCMHPTLETAANGLLSSFQGHYLISCSSVTNSIYLELMQRKKKPTMMAVIQWLDFKTREGWRRDDIQPILLGVILHNTLRKTGYWWRLKHEREFTHKEGTDQEYEFLNRKSTKY